MDWRDHLTSGLVAKVMGYPVIGHPVAAGAALGSTASYAAATGSTQGTAGQSFKAVTGKPNTTTVSRYPTKSQQYIDHVAKGTRVKPTLRPVFPCSKKNTDTSDRQEQQDLQKFIATGHKYWAQLNKPYHHHHKADLSSAPCPEDHIYADRGRHKPEWCRSSSIFDPITSTSRPIASPDKYRAELRPQSAPRCRSSPDAATDNGVQQAQLFAQKRPGSARAVQGRYNPLTHTWVTPPDPAAHATRQKEADRVYGMIGIRTCNSPYSPNRDTGTAQVLKLDEQPQQQVSAAAAAAATPGAVSGSEYTDRSPGSSSGSSRRCQSAPRMIRDHGDSWGTYDCLRHKWMSPPNNKRFINKEAATCGVNFGGGSSPTLFKKVPRPPGQGVYNPITCQWQVLPNNKRTAEGLAFAPVKMFKEKAFTTR